MSNTLINVVDGHTGMLSRASAAFLSQLASEAFTLRTMRAIKFLVHFLLYSPVKCLSGNIAGAILVDVPSHKLCFPRAAVPALALTHEIRRFSTLERQLMGHG